ncbi:hypothetical protein C8R43DRAFT_954955 [Mycena crocata]|nr:hypothetical protein C8R43DRAFT_954955 [Mycena crocata]
MYSLGIVQPAGRRIENILWICLVAIDLRAFLSASIIQVFVRVDMGTKSYTSSVASTRCPAFCAAINVVQAVGPAALNTTVAGWKPAGALDKAPSAFGGNKINHNAPEDKEKDVGNGVKRRERETGSEGNSPAKKVKLGEKSSEGEVATA